MEQIWQVICRLDCPERIASKIYLLSKIRLCCKFSALIAYSLPFLFFCPQNFKSQLHRITTERDRLKTQLEEQQRHMVELESLKISQNDKVV